MTSPRYATPRSSARQANRGHLDTSRRRRPIIIHALTFLLFQALLISSIAGVLSFLLGLMLNHRVAANDPPTSGGGTGTGTGIGGGGGGVDGPHREGYTPPGAQEFVLVVGTGMAAATISSLILGSFMSSLIITCRSLGVDPDNIASPLAATLGDLLTLFIMALVGTGLVNTLGTPGPVVVLLLMCGVTAGIGWRLKVMKGRHTAVSGRKRLGRKEKTEEEADEGGWSPLVRSSISSSIAFAHT